MREYESIAILKGPLPVVEGVSGVSHDEFVVNLGDERRCGKVIILDGDKAVVQVFEGTVGFDLENVKTGYTDRTALSIWLTRLSRNSSSSWRKENTAHRLEKEMKKTKKGVNALENTITSQLGSQIKWIQEVPEESEREEFVRVKKVNEMVEKR